MTYWVIKQSLEEYKRLKLDDKKIIISINISSIMLTDLVLPDEIIRITKELNINPQYVCFEITESATRKQPELVLEILTRLRIFGFELSIDDFGTGYSSLFELKRLPFTEMKIDKSFIYNLENNQLNQSIVKSIAFLSHNLNMTLVAEGVESKKCFNLLGEYDCDIAQGYLISKALPANSLVEFINSRFSQDLVWDGLYEEENS
jgi:EAL domain-containing protein (putative c-di-GMP-specific phosphodiesterase class I)